MFMKWNNRSMKSRTILLLCLALPCSAALWRSPKSSASWKKPHSQGKCGFVNEWGSRGYLSQPFSLMILSRASRVALGAGMALALMR